LRSTSSSGHARPHAEVAHLKSRGNIHLGRLSRDSSSRHHLRTADSPPPADLTSRRRHVRCRRHRYHDLPFDASGKAVVPRIALSIGRIAGRRCYVFRQALSLLRSGSRSSRTTSPRPPSAPPAAACCRHAITPSTLSSRVMQQRFLERVYRGSIATCTFPSPMKPPNRAVRDQHDREPSSCRACSRRVSAKGIRATRIPRASCSRCRDRIRPAASTPRTAARWRSRCDGGVVRALRAPVWPPGIAESDVSVRARPASALLPPCDRAPLNASRAALVRGTISCVVARRIW